MAKRSKRLTGAALARARVRVSRPDGATIYSLPVNPGFAEPNEPDEARGVEYPGAIENIQAEQGIARRVMGSLQPENLQNWIRGQIRRKGGANNLARQLLAQDTPGAAELGSRDRTYRAMLRKVEEWREGKYKRAGGKNAVRVGLLLLREARHVVLGVRGLWELPDRGDSAQVEERYMLFNTEPGEGGHATLAREVLRHDGDGFIDLVRVAVAETVHNAGGEVTLLQTLELRVELGLAPTLRDER